MRRPMLALAIALLVGTTCWTPGAPVARAAAAADEGRDRRGATRARHPHTDPRRMLQLRSSLSTPATSSRCTRRTRHGMQSASAAKGANILVYMATAAASQPISAVRDAKRRTTAWA